MEGAMDAQVLMEQFIEYLRSNRGLSEHTCMAYRGDILQCLKRSMPSAAGIPTMSRSTTCACGWGVWRIPWARRRSPAKR